MDGYQGATGAVSLRVSAAPTNDIYSTDFENFPIGSNQIFGRDGWIAFETPSGAVGAGTSGILTDPASGTHAGYVGFNTTTNSGVLVYRPVNYNPAGTANPVVQFSVDLSVIPTTNAFSDAFLFNIYNREGQALAGVLFDPFGHGVYRYDNSTYQSVGTFTNSTRYTLVCTINFSTNRWSVTLGGAALFTDQRFNATNRSLSLGEIAADWLISKAGSPGTSYLIFDNYRISVVPTAIAPTITTQPIDQTAFAGYDVTFSIAADGTPSPTYRWQVSVDSGTSWSNLSDALPYGGSGTAMLTITAATSDLSGRQYRCVAANGMGSAASNAATLTVRPAPGVVAVATGYGFTLFVRGDGSLWGYGDNTLGQLGPATLCHGDPAGADCEQCRGSRLQRYREQPVY